MNAIYDRSWYAIAWPGKSLELAPYILCQLQLLQMDMVVENGEGYRAASKHHKLDSYNTIL